MNTQTASDTIQLPVLVESKLPFPFVDRSRIVASGREDQIRTVVQDTSISDTASIMAFGAKAQKDMSSHLDELLADSTVGQAGVGGELAVELSRGIERMNLKRMRLELDGKDFFAKVFGGLPVIGPMVSALRAFQIDRSKIVTEFERIERKGEDDKAALITAVAKYDALVDRIEKMLVNIEIHLAAGEDIMARERKAYDDERNALLTVEAGMRDPVRTTKLKDRFERLEQFETRLVRLHIAYTKAIQSIPEIRNAQRASEIEMQNVIESLLSDVPDLKKAIVQMVSLNATRKAKEGVEANRRVAGEISRLATDATAQAYLEAKQSQGDFTDELARLEYQAKVVLDTIAKGREIAQKNAQTRQGVIEKTKQMREAFDRALTQEQGRLPSLG
jgi:uncharacterized protein YaaN involved in tellurite resistance